MKSLYLSEHRKGMMIVMLRQDDTEESGKETKRLVKTVTTIAVGMERQKEPKECSRRRTRNW